MTLTERSKKQKESPVFNVTTSEIRKLYQFIYLFILDVKKRKGSKVTQRHRNAVKEPGWGASEILYLAMYGYSKKNKFAKKTQYLRWNRAPYGLEKRVISLLGQDCKIFLEKQRDNMVDLAEKIERTPEAVDVDLVSYTFRTDEPEVTRRMQRYIEDFDLHSAIDQDVLKNLVKTQMLIEYAHRILIKEGSTYNTNLDIKSLSEQLKNYITLLGLSKKDRIDFGSERKKGSIGELASVYEETLREYPETEQEFLVEELEMLLDKYDRLDYDGNREISAKVFQIVSGGYSVKEAREMTGRKKRKVESSKRTSDT